MRLECNFDKITKLGKINIEYTYTSLDNPGQHYDKLNIDIYNNTKNEKNINI